MEDQDAYDLLNAMTRLSIRIFGTEWHDDLEYLLWDALELGSLHAYGYQIDRIEVDQLRRLHERAGGWWIQRGMYYQFLRTPTWLNLLEY